MKIQDLMRSKYFFMGILFILASATHTKAQVTIGSGNPPKDYAILQIDGTGGVRLPKLTLSEREELERTFDSKAAGLVIYFDDEGGPNSCFQFWDGSKWISMRYMNELVNAKNGITDTKTVLSEKAVKIAYELGGSLTENTTIKQPENKLLRFNPATGSFSVMHNALVITDESVGMGKTPSNNALLELTGSIGQAFRYQTEGIQAGYVLASDASGYASWVDLEPKADLTSKSIQSKNIASTAGTPVQIADPMPLEPGIWLIIVRYVAKSGNGITTTDWGANAWLSLKKEGESDEIVRIGQVPQLMNTIMTATPQLVYMLKVPEAANYILYGSLSTGGASFAMQTYPSTTTEGNSYFNAIRLSDDPN